MKNRTRILFYTPTAIVIFIGSLTTYRPISLERLVELTHVVVIARPAVPPETTVRIDISPWADKPPFIKRVFRYTVQEVLYPLKERRELIGQTIEVDPAEWKSNLSFHKKFFLEGLSLSPVYAIYEPDEGKDAGTTSPETSILFLQDTEEESRFSFTVTGAKESMVHRTKIETLLKAKKPLPDLPRTDAPHLRSVVKLRIAVAATIAAVLATGSLILILARRRKRNISKGR